MHETRTTPIETDFAQDSIDAWESFQDATDAWEAFMVALTQLQALDPDASIAMVKDCRKALRPTRRES